MRPNPVSQTLERLAEFLSVTQDPWWILGSMAVFLKGYDPGRIGDIDVLVSEGDAARLMSHHGLANDKDGGTSRYRSNYVLQPILGDLPIDLLAGYEIFYGETWRPIEPKSHQQVTYDGITFYVLADEELIALFEMLGRAKDLDRIRAMQTR